MTGAPIGIVRTGVANTASLRAAFARLGAESRLIESPEDVAAAPLLVLPGVGAFGAGKARLEELGVAEVIRERIESDRPTLAVCLGMQLLGAGSEESPGVAGLGVIDAVATAFPASVRAPQMGWSRIEPIDPAAPLLRSAYFYFANSYRFIEPPAGWSVAMADHGGVYVAAMRRGAALACQFHPELSGPDGLRLLARWMAAARTRASDPNGAPTC